MVKIIELIQEFIDKGLVTEEELNQKIEEMKTKSSLIPLQERVEVMQNVDDFTLQNTMTIDSRTAGLQEVDDFTLQQLMLLQQRIDDLELRVTTLEGGTV